MPGERSPGPCLTDAIIHHQLSGAHRGLLLVGMSPLPTFSLDGGVLGAEGRLRVCRPSGVHRRFLPGRNQRFVRPGFP